MDRETYLGKLFDYICDEHALIGFLILNFVTKLMFSLWMMDSHHDILDTNELVLLAEQKANESRRSFLRYVLHEVRVPLNTITMGLHLLKEEDDETREQEGPLFFYLLLLSYSFGMTIPY